ncbi:reverse transcriptase [Trichonephila clavipes]|nr:reverse transcriptase [Trichonephila clavipes]
MPTSAIKDLLKKWADVRAMVFPENPEKERKAFDIGHVLERPKFRELAVLYLNSDKLEQWENQHVETDKRWMEIFHFHFKSEHIPHENLFILEFILYVCCPETNAAIERDFSIASDFWTSSNTPTDCHNTIQCRTKNVELISYGWTPALQCVPSHVGVHGNERADQKAESSQPEVPLALRRAKSIISTYIDKYTAMTQKTRSFGKPWETLATVGPIPRLLERAEAVTRFHLTNGYDFLGIYLHWLGVAANEACPICGHARMHGDHLLQCTGLDEYPPTTSSVGTGRFGGQEAKHGRWINK